jgi:hypothetical protein
MSDDKKEKKSDLELPELNELDTKSKVSSSRLQILISS